MNADKSRGVKRKLLSSSESDVSNLKPRQALLTNNGAAGDSVRPCKGQSVYVHSAEDGWREGLVIDTDPAKSVITVHMEETDQIANCCTSHVLLCSEKPLDDLNNLTHISPVHEASVLSCLHKRFSQGRYYTNAGTTVIAVNPFTDVSHLYSLHQIWAYHSRTQELPPHIYPVAETAYSSLVRELGQVNQSIIISGESGAGKTVSAKHLLRYLTIVTNPSATDSRLNTSDDTGVKIEQRILDSNPILEAFGNAATPRNSNSSRFGKFIELQFLRMGQIQGGAIQTYLLEKTRVVHQGQDENNFHVFYQMTGLTEEDGAYADWVKDMQLEVCENSFTCVPHNQDCTETRNIRETLDAMTNIGLRQDMQKEAFQILMAILHLGNMRFIQVSDDRSDLESSMDSSQESFGSDDSFIEVSVSERALERSSQLLGVDPVSLRQTLLHRCLQAGSRSRQSVFVKPIGIAEARSRRDCLAMLLYSRLFEWLVSFINNQIKSDFFDNTIGLLDIYGFEIFAMNSLEQLCINYANERLQQHYVAHFLENLQKEYTEECLHWVPVDYGDNRPCVSILDGRTSVFSILNEEVYLNRKSDDEALKERLLELSSKSQNSLRPARRSVAGQPSFVVQHYAGEVQYLVSDLVTKNKDDIPSDLISLLTASTSSFVQELFSSYSQEESPAGRKKKTVLSKFKSSLDDLIMSMLHSDIHYIRCLKPNDTNTPGVFQRPYVLQQLRACGTIETVDICRRGYPARMPYSEFQQRYSTILRSERAGQGHREGDSASSEGEQKENLCDPLDLLLRQQLDLPASPKRTPTPRKKLRRRTGLTQHDHACKVCATILQTVVGHTEQLDLQHQFGRTKLFLTEWQLEQLECARLQVLTHNAVVLQSAWRGYCCRRQYWQMLAAWRIWQAWLTFRARRRFLCVRKAAIILQRGLRQWLHELHCKHQREAARKTEFLLSTASSSSPNEDFLSLENSSTDGIPAVVPVSSPLESCETSSPAMDGNISDDSGVMVHEPVRCRRHTKTVGERRTEDLEPPQKRQRLQALAAQLPQLKGVHVGDGLVTWRRIPKFGCRFHVRPSVLKYAHVTNRQDLPSGLADALTSADQHSYEGQSAGSSVDP